VFAKKRIIGVLFLRCSNLDCLHGKDLGYWKQPGILSDRYIAMGGYLHIRIKKL